jgi:hypothetical protein
MHGTAPAAANTPSAPLVVGVHGDRCVAQHRLWARGRDHDLAAAVLQRVRKAGEHAKLDGLRRAQAAACAWCGDVCMGCMDAWGAWVHECMGCKACMACMGAHHKAAAATRSDATPHTHAHLVVAGHADECAPRHVDVIHLDVRHRREQARVPVDQPVVAVDAARLVHAHKRLQHRTLRAALEATWWGGP